MPILADFLKRLYKKRQQTDDPALRRLYQIAERARTDPEINAARRVFEEELSIDGQAFDRMFASYWLSLEITGSSRDWNLELEPIMKEVGITENALIVARTHFTTAVINRVFLRVAMDGLSKARGHDLEQASSTEKDQPRQVAHDCGDAVNQTKLIKSVERMITAMIDEGARKNRKDEVVARLLAAQKELGDSN